MGLGAWGCSLGTRGCSLGARGCSLGAQGCSLVLGAGCMGLQPLELEQAALLFAHFDADSDAACREREPPWWCHSSTHRVPRGGLCRHLAALRTRGEPTSRSRPR